MDNFTCMYCGRRPPDVALEVDHAISLFNNGSEHMENYVTACEECNSGKSRRNVANPADDWFAEFSDMAERYKESKQLLANLEQYKNNLRSEITQFMQINMPNATIINDKPVAPTIKVSAKKISHQVDRFAKICAALQEDGRACFGFTDHGVCTYSHTGHKPILCPISDDEFAQLYDTPVEGLLEMILLADEYICELCHGQVKMADRETHKCY
jgi:hypothetical protein